MSGGQKKIHFPIRLLQLFHQSTALPGTITGTLIFFFVRASSKNLSMQTASLKKTPAIQDKLLSPPFNPGAAEKPLPSTCSGSIGITARQGPAQTHQAHTAAARGPCLCSMGMVGEGPAEESVRLLHGAAARGSTKGQCSGKTTTGRPWLTEGQTQPSPQGHNPGPELPPVTLGSP